jgi:hypothetical protein
MVFQLLQFILAVVRRAYCNITFMVFQRLHLYVVACRRGRGEGSCGGDLAVGGCAGGPARLEAGGIRVCRGAGRV